MRSQIRRSALLMIVAALACALPVGANAEDAPSSDRPPREFLGGVGIEPGVSGWDVALDVILVRHLRLIKIPMGFGIFLASLPMYIVAWDVPAAWDFLVDAPVEEAIFTPLGRI